MSGRPRVVPPPPPRAFAIVPAAGESRRMGTPKLLLPWHGSPLIAHAITAWQTAGLRPLVVVRPQDSLLAKVCRGYGAEVIVPATAPAQMKISVQLALEYIQQKYRPTDDFAWLLAPADMPRLFPAIINRLLTQHAAANTRVLVPTYAGKRGHPVLFPWPLAREVFRLSDQEGINALVARYPSQDVACDDLFAKDRTPNGGGYFIDIDTPADYASLRRS